MAFPRPMKARFFKVAATIVGGLCMAFAARADAPYVVNAKVTSPNTVTIVFSAPVFTTFGSYSNFNGDLAAWPLTSVSGSGGNVITLAFGGAKMSTGASGQLSINASTIGASDGAPFTIGSSVVNVTDGQPPVIAAFSASVNAGTLGRGLVMPGDTVTLSFTASEPLLTAGAIIAGRTVNLSGGGSGPYTASYVISSTDAPGAVPFTIDMTDLAGNAGSRVSSTLSFNGSGTAAAAPTISSITSNARGGVLKIGDSIVFTLTPAVPDASAKIAGSYNGTPLVWTSLNGGSSFTAAYTVTSGSQGQTAPLQISGVTMTNAAGAVSAAASGNDVNATIDTGIPVISEAAPMPSSVNTATPAYAFLSSVSGTIGYSGDCWSAVTTATAGANTVTFLPLADGRHDNCALRVTRAAGNPSKWLLLPPFTVSAAAPISNAGFVFSRPLSYGSSGDDVRELQRRLKAEGLYDGGIVGFFGRMTERAVRKFQKKYGLKTLGIVGPATRALLNSGR